MAMAMASATREDGSALLSDPLLLTVFTYLPLRYRCRCAVAWRQARSLTEKHPPLVLRLCNATPALASNVLQCASSSRSSLSALDLHGFCRCDDINPYLSLHRQLLVLDLSHCRPLPSTVLRHLPSSLKELSLWDADIVPNRPEPDDEDSEEEEIFPVRLPRLELEQCFRHCSGLEVLDLRGQGGVDDEIAVEVLGNLQNLRKVALHGTKVTIQGGASLLQRRQGTLTRAGFGGLLRSPSDAVPTLCGDVLRELALPFASSPVNVDLARMPNLDFLYIDGAGTLGGGMHRVLDWNHLATTRVRQLMLNYATLPADIFSILLPLAPRLKHLSFVKSQLVGMGNRRQRATPPPSFLEACLNLVQLGLTSPNIETTMALASLPSLRILVLDAFSLPSVLDFSTKAGETSLFQGLEELVLSDTPSVAEFGDTACALLRTVPLLKSLVWRTQTSVTSQDVFVMLAGLREPRDLQSLNLEGLSKFSVVEDARTFVARLVTAVPSLQCLVVPADLLQVQLFIDSVMSCFPSLQVLGGSQTRSFGGWVERGGRYVLSYDVYGYDEAECVKPARSFVNLLSFVDIDQLFGMSAP